MIIDIAKFLFIYTLVVFAFGCGLNQLLWYYAELEKNKCYHLPNGSPDFEAHDRACTVWRRYAKISAFFFSLFETTQSLFWASFGLIDLMSFELTGIKTFTRFWALLMFGSYSVINIIVLLNMLIAMMSNSFQTISERADVEWKFARSRLWIDYFGDGGVLPPPYNIFPNIHTFCGFLAKRKHRANIDDEWRRQAKDRHDTIVRILIQRFVTAEQRKRHDFHVTEDDVVEIRQDISSLRCEIVDILGKSGLNTTNVSFDDTQGKKGKMMERRILKDFQIGTAQVVKKEVKKKSSWRKLTYNVKQSSLKKKKDWNALVRQNASFDPIGSSKMLKSKSE